MTVDIPEELTKRIQGLGPHLCLVDGKNPNVGGKGWQLPENLMFADDPKLQAWLKTGKNYGVVCGYGLIVIEADQQKIKAVVEEKLPPTFAILSPGHQMPHYYFLCSMEECKPLIDPDNKNEDIGYIKAQGGMVVGPDSVHPDVHKKYKILYDRDLAQVSPQQVREALKPYMVPERQTNRVNTTVTWEKQQGFNINILDVVPMSGLRRQGNELIGPHPTHGSKGGRNFSVNPSKNKWFCFRHWSGGGPLYWLAVEEGIIDCAEAVPGALRGEVFKRALEKAVEKGLIDESEIKTSIKKGKKAKKQEEPRLVDKLIDIALSSGIQLFEDDRGEAYAILEGGGHHEIHRVEGRTFERWLRKKYFELEQKGLRKETLNDASATLAAIAQFQEPPVKRKLHNRVAWHNNSIYYDLADEKWRAIKISANGWEIARAPLFRRFPHQQAQVAPVEGGSLDELFTFVNVTDPKDQLRVKVYLVAMLVPDIPHPILLVLGPQGCGKSDLMRVLRMLVDPSAVLLQSFRYDELEMALKVFHHYVVYFDNLSSIKQWLSDILCRACTGQGFTKRRLYTNEDSVIFQFQRCVGVNGIALSQLSPDFLDRCLTLTLKQIPSEKRKHERELWREFREAKPRIFGAILDTLSKAMKIYPTVEMEHLPRMADFAMWGEAAARALGYKPGEFLDAYHEKIGEQVRDVLEDNPIGLAILALMENETEWEGTPGELLEKLEEEQFVKEHKIDTDAEKWPGAANWVTKRIKEIETNLEHEGVKFATKRVKGRRVITLTKTEKFGHDDGESRDVSEKGHGDSSDGNDGISHTKNVANMDVQHRLVDVGSKKVSTRDTVTTVLPSPCALESEEHEKTSRDWDGFHVIGPYPPDVAYKKTVASIRELQKTASLTREDVKQAVAYYWTEESHSKVRDRLLKEGVIDKVQGKILQKIQKELGTSEGFFPDLGKLGELGEKAEEKKSIDEIFSSARRLRKGDG